MRWFIAFLLVANAILFFWAQHQGRPAPGSTVVPLSDVGLLRLGSEIERSDGFESVAPSDSHALGGLPADRALVGQSAALVPPRIDSQDARSDGERATQTSPARGTPLSEAEAEPPTKLEATLAAVEEIEFKRQAAQTPGIGASGKTQSEVELQELAPSETRQIVVVPGAVQSAAADVRHSVMRPRESTGEDAEPGADNSLPVTEAQLVCSRLGPLAAKDADALVDRLPQHIELRSDDAEELSEVTGHYVLIPPLPTRAEGLRKAKELKAAGIDDIWLFRAGEFRNGISLGLFTRKATARKHADNIGQKGFAVEVRDRTSIREQRWLELQHNRDSDLQAALSLPEGAGVSDRPCL